MTGEDWDGDLEEFKRVMATIPPEEFADFLDSLPEAALVALMKDTASFEGAMPNTPLAQAMELDSKFVSRPHLEYLSNRIAVAVEDVRAGTNRMIMVSMPPRSGKSYLISEHLPVWLLRQQPGWKYALVSWAPNLAQRWSRNVRAMIKQFGPSLGVELKPGAETVENWETTAGGEVHARSVGQGMTGDGANVMIIDDPMKSSLMAHSSNYRQMIWEQWTANFQTRLEQPFLVILVMTRWHEDDLAGRLRNPDIEGANPEEWEVISFPAIADHDPEKGERDVLGREVGDPLLSPLVKPDRTAALEWWGRLKKGMSSYDFSAQYQQHPAPAQGAIFNVDWWKYWTTRPELVTYYDDEKTGEPDLDRPDGRVILRPDLSHSTKLDSWDLNFDDTVNSDFVVRQLWAQSGSTRYLLKQRRGRWDFPETLKQFREANAPGSGEDAQKHLVEKKANGAAMIKMLADEFSGIKPINPTTSKENRARAVTYLIEAGNVRLPDPREFPWVNDLLDELREFPSGAHDDQVDVLTQALDEMRDDSLGSGISIPSAIQEAMARRKAEGLVAAGRPAAAGPHQPGETLGELTTTPGFQIPRIQHNPTGGRGR